MEAAGIAVPQGLTYAAVDFEQQILASGLELSGFDPNLPAFFSWLGVTPHLTRESCMAMLGDIGKLPAGTGVAFDFAVEPRLLGWRQRLALYVLSRRVADAGRVVPTILPPRGTCGRTQHSLGFRRTEILGAEEIKSRFFSRRTDGLRVGGDLERLMGAGV